MKTKKARIGPETRDQLIIDFWTLLEPELEAYSNTLDWALHKLPYSKLRELVERMR